MIQKKIYRNRKFILIFLLTLILASLTYSSLIVADDDEDEEDDDEDFAKDVGYISIGLLAGGCINVVVLNIYKLSRRFLDDEGKKKSVKGTIRNIYLKTRKPLNYLHYLLTLAGTSIILYHGIVFVDKDEEVGVFGWISVGIFLFYVVTGVLIKLKIKPLWNSIRARKILNLTHRTLILFLVVIAIHVVHILLAD